MSFKLSRPPIFDYEALERDDSIRLVRLLPSTTITSPILCQLLQTTLEACITDDQVGTKLSDPFGYDEFGYTALSYAWGDANNNRKISLDGKPFYITANLESALRHIRLQDKAVTLWIDAICINQDDVMERSHQVRQMCSIYTHASSTVIYNGDATVLSSTAFKRFFAPGSFTHEETADVLSRPWFTRVWVFQEIVVSRCPWIYCGQNRLPWEKFRAMLNSAAVFPGSTQFRDRRVRFDSHLSRIVATYNVIVDIDWARYLHRVRQLGQFELLDLLLRRRGFAASDPRDIIYALTGIVPTHSTISEADRGFIVDYTKTCSEVYYDAAVLLLSSRRDYDALTYADSPAGSDSSRDLPSWVPDWRSSDNYYDNTILDALRERPAGDSMDCHVYIQPGVIACRGERPWQTLLHVSPVLDQLLIEAIGDSPSQPSSSFTSSRLEYLEARNSKHLYNKWRKIIGENILPPCDDEDNAMFNFWTTGSYLSSNYDGASMETTLNHVSSLLWENMVFMERNSMLAGRRIAITTSGKLALVSAKASEGDLICRFTGSKVPFVLHPVDRCESPNLDQPVSKYFQGRVNDIRYCTFAGECTLDGAMGGVTAAQWSGSTFPDTCYVLY